MLKRVTDGGLGAEPPAASGYGDFCKIWKKCLLWKKIVLENEKIVLESF